MSEKKQRIDWAKANVDALNRHTSTPEFKRKYLQWLEDVGAHTPVAKADLEALRAEKARGEF